MKDKEVMFWMKPGAAIGVITFFHILYTDGSILDAFLFGLLVFLLFIVIIVFLIGLALMRDSTMSHCTESNGSWEAAQAVLTIPFNSGYA